jgi:antitoxin HicB
MSALSYPARFKKDRSGACTVTFPDLPEAITCGRDVDDAVNQAADCLQEALAGRMVRREAIPLPSALQPGHRMVAVALYLAPKLALYLAMRRESVNSTELARRLGVTEAVIRRMLDPHHNTRPDRLQAALAVLGVRLLIEARAA